MPKELLPTLGYESALAYVLEDEYSLENEIPALARNTVTIEKPIIMEEPLEFTPPRRGSGLLKTVGRVGAALGLTGLAAAGVAEATGRINVLPGIGPEKPNGEPQTSESTDQTVVTTTPQRVQVGGGTPEVFAQAPDTGQMTQAAAETPTRESSPTPEPTPTLSVEQRAEQLANMPIILTVDSEARENAPFVTEFTFDDKQVNHPISGELIPAEEAVRQAGLISFGWTAGIENAHQISKDQLVQELARKMLESPDGMLHTQMVSHGFNYSRRYEEVAIDPTKGINIIVEPWNLPLPDGYIDLYLMVGGQPDYTYRVADENGQTQIHISFNSEQAEVFDYVPRLPFNDALLLAFGEIAYPEEKSIGLEKYTAIWRYLVRETGGGMGQFAPFIEVGIQTPE